MHDSTILHLEGAHDRNGRHDAVCGDLVHPLRQNRVPVLGKVPDTKQDGSNISNWNLTAASAASRPSAGSEPTLWYSTLSSRSDSTLARSFRSIPLQNSLTTSPTSPWRVLSLGPTGCMYY